MKRFYLIKVEGDPEEIKLMEPMDIWDLDRMPREGCTADIVEVSDVAAWAAGAGWEHWVES